MAPIDYKPDCKVSIFWRVILFTSMFILCMNVMPTWLVVFNVLIVATGAFILGFHACARAMEKNKK